jgi:hypothetical protein
MVHDVLQGLMDKFGAGGIYAGFAGPASLLILILLGVAARDIILRARKRRALREPRQDEEWVP